MKRALLASLALVLSLAPRASAGPSAAETVSVYVGSYAAAKDNGIHHFTLNPDTGALTAAGGTSGVANPSFVAISPDKKFLYAIGEAALPGKKGGAVASFSIDDKGGLKLITLESSVGSGPCFVTADKTGKVVLVANYGGGSVASLPVSADGKLSEAASFIQHAGSSVNKGRQGEPHAHSINVSPDNKFAFAADLGLDKILIYKLDPEKGTLTPNEPAFAEIPPGSGPRHFAFHPSGKYAYVCGEMTSTVHAMTYDAEKGVLKVVQSLSTLPEPVKGNSTAETQVHPSGKFVYVSNRGHNSVAVFTVDEATGLLRAAGHAPSGGKTPRNFGIDPTGKFLIAANQDSNNVVVFKIDPKTGMPGAAVSEVSVPKPVCVKFLVH